MNIDKYLNREDEFDPEAEAVRQIVELTEHINSLHACLHSRPLLSEKDSRLVVDKAQLKEMKAFVNDITYDFPYVNRSVKELS